MEREAVLVGIDVGTSKVCALIGEVSRDGTLTIVGKGVVPASGLKKAVVVNIDQTVRSISGAVDHSERLSGYQIDRAFVGVGGQNVESQNSRMVVDVTCDTSGEEHADVITRAIAQIPGATVRKVSDRTFLMHLGGKIEVTPKVPLKHRDDLSRAYTPGVARVCLAIAEHPEDARHLTIKRNTVAVVTDGSAVLGLGNIGAAAAAVVIVLLVRRSRGRRTEER